MTRKTATTEQWGFTLIELLLSIALIGIITGLTTGIYFSLQLRNGLDIAASSLAQGLRRAQGLAQAGDSDSGWGVYVQAGTITVFKGASYASRDQTADETTTIASNVSVTGAQETDFTKFTGDPTATATYTLSSSGTTKTITVNAKGMVSV